MATRKKSTTDVAGPTEEKARTSRRDALIPVVIMALMIGVIVVLEIARR